MEGKGITETQQEGRAGGRAAGGSGGVGWAADGCFELRGQETTHPLYRAICWHDMPNPRGNSIPK